MRQLIRILFFVQIFSCTKNPAPPTDFGTKVNVSTSSVFNLASSSVSSGGRVSSVSGLLVTERGICWGASANPTISTNRKTAGTGDGNFTASITGLAPNRMYYIRAYATNSVGTFYGNNVSFVTLSQPPTVSTASITNIRTISASGGGSVLSDGGLPVTARGVVWSAVQDPTIALSTKTSNGSGIGSFSSAISGLAPGTTYYIRAYATNSSGTSYGLLQAFTTQNLAQPVLDFPANGSVYRCCSNINFTWSAVTDAQNYEIQISRFNNFPDPVYSLIFCGGGNAPFTNGMNQAFTASTGFCVSAGPNTSYNGIWYWRVRAFRGNVSGPWSATGSYTYNY
jgi:hypothetical protein